MFDKDYMRAIEERIFQEGIAQKEKGARIAGLYCTFTPKELIAAAGAIPVSLCAGSQKPISDAEMHLPRNLCPLVKASYGFALTDTCPFFHFSDFILADATCDGKKKMFELMGRIKPLHLLQLPQTADTKESFDYWLTELYKLKDLLEETTGNTITEEELKKQIRLYNQCRSAVNEVFRLNTGETPLLYGREVDAIIAARGFECNLEERIREMHEAARAVRERAKDEAFLSELRSKPRILLTGCPTTNKKMLELIEDCGGIVAAQENCGGLKAMGILVREDIEPMTALAEKYINIACSCMTPNNKRLELIESIVRDYHIDGVVDLTWTGCHTYNIEAYSVKEFVTEKCGRPYIQIETDYTENDIQQIKVRIEAFLELLSLK